MMVFAELTPGPNLQLGLPLGDCALLRVFGRGEEGTEVVVHGSQQVHPSHPTNC